MKTKKAKTRQCPYCKGRGYMIGGTSIAMREAGLRPPTWKCECCLGKRRIGVDDDPDWWMISDNAYGNGGR